MKKLCSLIVTVGVFFGTKSYADLVGDTGTLTLQLGADQFANGGEFLATPATGVAASGGSFETFCLEYNEEFTPSATTQLTYQINTGAVSGDASYDSPSIYNNLALGKGQTMDNISVGTAWLYSQFRTGGLGTFTAIQQAGELQDAIWYLENEITYNQLNGGFNFSGSASATQLFASAAEAFVTQAASGTGTTWNTATGGTVFGDASSGQYGVYALNLFYVGSNYTNNAQDQLYYAPPIIPNVPPSSSVPEPTTIFAGALLLLPLGASAIRIIRKSKIN